MAVLLELDRVDKSYGALRVADGITLDVSDGEALGVIGPNGAGKSTLVKAVFGLVRPDSGEIRIKGDLISAGGYRSSD